MRPDVDVTIEPKIIINENEIFSDQYGNHDSYFQLRACAYSNQHGTNNKCT